MIVAILQARVSSSRFPGKVLKEILGKPMLLRQIERIQRSNLINKLIVATSNHPSDDAIEILCKGQGISCFRGSLDDVLDRYYQAACLIAPDFVVRLTGDCPLTDSDVIDQTINFCLAGKYDYVSNALTPTFPDGLDVEIIRFPVLKATWQEARLPSEKEHVTSFICNNPKRFKIGNFKRSLNLGSLRWTVDEPQDYELVKIIYEALYPVNSDFTTQDILFFLDQNPALKTFNTHIKRDEGYQISLMND